MTASELIVILSEADPDAEVIVNGYEDGYDPIDSVTKVDVFKKRVKASWEGKYSDAAIGKKSNMSGTITSAVLISRGGIYV
jgi:hypothetical protein